jgi:hypothetical protein
MSIEEVMRQLGISDAGGEWDLEIFRFGFCGELNGTSPSGPIQTRSVFIAIGSEQDYIHTASHIDDIWPWMNG